MVRVLAILAAILVVTPALGRPGAAAAETTYTLTAGPVPFRGYAIRLTATRAPGADVALVISLEKAGGGQTQFHRWSFTLDAASLDVVANLSLVKLASGKQMGTLGVVQLRYSPTKPAKKTRQDCGTTTSRTGKVAGTLRLKTGIPEFGTVTRVALSAQVTAVSTRTGCQPHPECSYGTTMFGQDRAGAFVSASKARNVEYEVSADSPSGPAIVTHGVSGKAATGALTVVRGLRGGKLSLKGLPHLAGYLSLKPAGALNVSTGSCGTSRFRAVKLAGPGIRVQPDAGPAFRVAGAGSGFLTQLTKG